MNKTNFINERGPLISLGLFLFVLTLGNLFLIWIFRESPQPKHEISAAKNEVLPPIHSSRSSQEVTRKTRLDPGRMFSVSVFYQGEQEIAGYKSSHNQDMYDVVGKIPDGEIKFTNEATETTGEEHYMYGKRQGLFQEYYAKGQLKKETFYTFGQVLRNKEYFIDGILRMEEDYTDALPLEKDREVGVGKVYGRNGVIKYEWNLTQSNPERFNKAYDVKGKCVLTNYFDDKGNIIKTEKDVHPDEQITPP